MVDKPPRQKSYLSIKQNSNSRQTDGSMKFEEQTALTSRSSEQAWMMLILVLLVLTGGLYWFSDRQNNQSAWSSEAVVEARTTVARPTEFVSSDQIPPDSEYLTITWPQSLLPEPMPVRSPNERLIRRYYNEVLNRQKWAVMDDLFAGQISYRNDIPVTMLSLTALKQTILAESTAYVELHYSIEQVTAYEDWVHVDWWAEGKPPLGEPRFWSGHTIWQVVDGKVVQMWTYDATRPQPYLADHYPVIPPTRSWPQPDRRSQSLR